MRVRLGRKGDYAVRSALDLAAHHGSGRRKAREVAEAAGVPPTYAHRILGDLTDAGLVTSRAGRHGGYELAAEPARVSLLAVVEAVDEDDADDTCLLNDEHCSDQRDCPVHAFWAAAQREVRAHLEQVSLADVLARRDARGG